MRQKNAQSCAREKGRCHSMDLESWAKEKNHAIALLGWASILTLLVVSMIMLAFFTRCGGEKVKEVIVEESPSPLPTPQGKCIDGTPVGGIKVEACEGGQRLYACKVDGGSLQVVLDTCGVSPTPSPTPGEDCNKVTFDENLKDVVERACEDCHRGFSTYQSAVVGIDEWIRRINLSSNDPRRMPKIPKPELPIEEKKLFEKWREDGLIKSKDECEGTEQTSHMSIDDVESEILFDLSRVDQNDRIFVRYLVASHVYNSTGEIPTIAKAATDKALNSIVERSRDVVLSTYVDEKKTILRVDLRSFELSRTDWLKIEAADRLDLVSNTDKGRVIKLLTATRKPWVHFDNFVDIVNLNSELYYEFLNVPEKFEDLVKKVGVEYEQDLKDLEAALLGNNDSPITNNKNRLVSRHESVDGYFYVTYDTPELENVPERNLFQFPLLKETGSKRIFAFEAGEVIYSLPNGLQGYALYDAKGNRQNEAPVNVVRDVNSPVAPAPVIVNAVSCHRCHAQGIIPARDEIRSHVLDNASEFGVDDVDRVRGLYKSQTSLSAIFRVDNNRFARALDSIGVDSSLGDPINQARDRLRLNWRDVDVAAYLFLRLDQFRVLLDSSDGAREQIGQLLSGGSITFDQFVQVLPVLKRDFRLFEDPIGG